jgi:2-phosphoglycerate kinase
MKENSLKNRLHKGLLNEDLKKSEINKIVDDKIKSKIESEVKKQLKTTANQKEIKKIVSNTLEEFYRIMWQRRQMWKGKIER